MKVPQLIAQYTCIFALCLQSATKAQGQIVPDRTLPTNTTVTLSGNVNTIAGGTRLGSNLFHSFLEFSVATGTQAYFNNTTDIQNIFGRVTGSNTSYIDGLIRTNGTANLFLINPNGIIFGPNAQLNVGGSFIGSTADSIKFSDGSEFSATKPQAPPLLTINVPIGLQLGVKPAPIGNQSTANSVSNPSLKVGLETPGKTLALVGGDLNLAGGYLTAAQGQVELGSVGSSGLVNLTPTATGFTLGYQNIPSFGNINLKGGAVVNTSGLGAGAIHVQGGQVSLSEGSSLVAQTLGNLNGGDIDIQASQFQLQGGGFISTSTFGSGNGGNLKIQADRVELTGTAPLVTAQQLLTGNFNPLKLSDGLYSFSAGRGAAGDVIINTNQLLLQNGANILTTAFASGAGGNIALKASAAELTNGSLLFTGSTGAGKAGDITVTAQQLQVLNGTSLSTTPGSTSTGHGGNVTVTANSIELMGTPSGAPVPDGLFTTTLGAGDAGDLTVTTSQLLLTDGAQVSTASTGQGRGGNLTVTADSTSLSGKSPDGRFLTGLFTSASLLIVSGQQGTAPAGNLSVTTGQLSLQDGAQISSATGSSGAAGNVTVNASQINVSGFASGVDPSVVQVGFTIGNGLVPSAIEADTKGAGQAGDLTIHTGQLAVRDGGEIGVRSISTGAAGNLEVTANSLQLSNQGTITATKVSGAGGNIKINTDTLTLDNSIVSTSASGDGIGGDINLNIGSLSLNNSKITATSSLGQGGDINLQAQRNLLLRHGSEISTRAGTQTTGGGNGGNIKIRAQSIVAIPRENSNINANAFQGSGGSINITAQGIFGFQARSQSTSLSNITASSALGINGVVAINQLNVDPSQGLVVLPEKPTNPSTQIATGCAADTGNSFIATGRGGLPENPTDTLRGRTVWQDLRLMESQEGQPQEVAQLPQTAQKQSLITDKEHPPLVAARGWVIHPNGQVELVAELPETTPRFGNLRNCL